jgi:hypothetical protein
METVQVETENLMCKLREYINEISRGVKLTAPEWRMFYRAYFVLFYFPDKQPRHVCTEESEWIKQLKHDHPSYTVEDLAFIFMRSKETIHRILNN